MSDTVDKIDVESQSESLQPGLIKTPDAESEDWADRLNSWLEQLNTWLSN